MVIELLCTTVVPLIWHRRVRHPASTRPSQVAVIVADVVVGVTGAVGIIRVIVLHRTSDPSAAATALYCSGASCL